MIDVHVLTHEGTRQDWLDQCLASLEDQPVNVFVVDNAGRSVGEGRARGYAMGLSPFVAYVDSDDYVLPGCFGACLEGLRAHRAVVTLERVEYEDGTFHPATRKGHSVAVYRRNDIAPLLPAMAMTPHSSDMRARALLRPTQLSVVGYVWRVYQSGGDHRLLTPEVYKQESAAWP